MQNISNLKNVADVCDKNPHRPSLECGYVRNGFLYATNGHIALKQSLELYQLSEEEIKFLEGKFLHRELLKDLSKCQTLAFTEDRIVGEKNGVKNEFFYSDDKVNYPNVDAVFPSALEAVDTIRIDFGLLNKASKCLIDSSYGIDIRFHGKTRAVLISTPNYGFEEQTALIMPRQVF